ncbi:unnamed protein product [Diamesa serratosioi]
MDSRIPKPSMLPKPKAVNSNFFDFNKTKNENDSKVDKVESMFDQKKPLSEINNKNFSQFRFKNQRAKSPDIALSKSKSFVVPKLRKSKSALDLTEKMAIANKRLQPAMETVPTKRFKGGPLNKQFPIKTQEKKTAILNTLKSSSTTTTLKKLTASTQVKPVPVMTSKILTKTPGTKVVVVASTKNIATNRPAPYDFKARHALLLEKFNTLKAKHAETQEQINTLEETNEKLEQSEKAMALKLTTTENELQVLLNENRNNKGEMEKINEINSILSVKNTALCSKLESVNEELTKEKMDCQRIKLAHELLTNEHVQLREKSGTLEHDFSQASLKLVASQDQLYSINIERKVLHNLVLDLRGNIRVFCRVRPPLSDEETRTVCGWSFMDESSLEIHSNEVVGGTRKLTKYDFAFDHVFNPNSAQLEIFEMVSPLIQSALDGYNVCIFAYGQTGSGKTYTMDGIENDPGIIPRTVQLLFDSVKTAEILGWHYEISASFLEIYNEVLYDLLSNDSKDVEIRMANAKSKTEIYVSNLTEEVVTTTTRLIYLMNIARNNRATASTVSNERSSRSHAVTRIQIVGRHASKPEKLVGNINLVDLAGSESPKTSTRMDETKNINRSLSELSNVILALVQKNEHIPYRNSKLTHLLMPSLGGNSKTLMFVNAAPFQDCFSESVKSLRFAAQVNSCKLAKAKKNKQLNVSTC